MSGAPCVQIFVDAATGKRIPEPAKLTLQPLLLPTAEQTAVSCDATGRIVVRTRVDRATVVCAVARWRDGQVIEREQIPGGLAEAQWAELSNALSFALEAAAHQGSADRTALDPGVLGSVTQLPAGAVPKARPHAVVRAAQWIGAVIALGLLIAGVMGYEWLKSQLSNRQYANGEKCSFDADCASKNCTRGACRARLDAVLPNGDRCESDGECQSNNCSLKRICIAR